MEGYSYDGSVGSVICLMSSIRLATKETDDEHENGGKLMRKLGNADT